MPPSPTYKTNYAGEALSLLTSRYQTRRPTIATLSQTFGALSLSAAASVFRPTSISGCALWLRADLGITIGTGVSGWADQSGTGDANKNLAQATGSKQPTLIATDAAYNNKPMVSFAHANGQYLRSGTWAAALSQPFTVFIVGNDDLASGNQDWINDNAPAIRLVATAAFGLIGTATIVGGTNSTAARVLGLVGNGVSSAIYDSAATPVATGNIGTGGFAGTTLGIYAGDLVSDALNGKIAEVIMYSRALSAGEIGQVFTYVHNRYAITIGP